MSEGPSRPYSTPGGREYQESMRQAHNMHQQDYEQYHRERAQQFREIENSQTEKYPYADGDRSSLIKRINTLLVEVDRLSQEKSDLTNALHEERLISGEIQRKAKNSGKAKNIVDRNLQSDLKFEKEENSRLRHLLHQIEIERAELRSKLKDYELASNSSAYEKKELLTKLQQKSDQCLILETDNRALMEKILFLQNKINEFEDETSKLAHDRASLCETVSRLEVERSEILMKLHEEIARGEHFQMTKNSEIENMKWIQKRHCRLLASRSIGLELEKLCMKIYGYSINCFRESITFNHQRVKGSRKILANAIKCFFRKQKNAFDCWRRSLNWKGTQFSRLQLVDAYNQKISKAKIFAEWRSLFLHKLRLRRQQSLCVSILARLFKDSLFSSLKNRFIQFKSFTSFDKSKDYSTSKLTIRAFMGKLRSALHLWRRFSEKMKESQAREDLAIDFATNMVRAKFFYAFKEYVKMRNRDREVVQIKEDHADKLYQMSVMHELRRYTQKNLEKDRAVKKVVKRWVRKDQARAILTWKEEVRIRRRMERIELYLKGSDLQKSHVVKEKLFVTWKNFVTLNKLKRTQDELAYEKPLREQFENHYHVTVAEKRRIHQIKAGRIFAQCFRGELYSYFSHWKDHSQYFKESKPRIKRMILKEYMWKIGTAFRKWKESAMDIDFRNLHDRHTKVVESNNALLDHVNNLEEALNIQISKHNDLSRITMKRVVLRIQNFKLSTYLRTWAQRAFTISNMYLGASIIETKLRHFLFRKSLASIMSRSYRNKRRETTRKKLTYHVALQLKGNLSFTFTAWKQFLFLQRRFKQLLLKIAKRKSLIRKQFFMNKLKNKIKDLREGELVIYSQKVFAEKQALSQDFENLTESYKEMTAKADKFLKNLKKRSRLRIVNALIRCSQGSRRLFWDRWLAAIHLRDSKVLKMARLKNLWDKNREKRAWRTWILFIKKKFEVISEMEITSLKKNTKAIQREAKGLQESLQRTIQEKESVIESCEGQIVYTEKINEFLLNRGTKHFEEEYSESRAMFAFKAMKTRYQAIKKCVLDFTSLFLILRKKHALMAIKEEAKNVENHRKYFFFVEGYCKKFNKRFLRNRFHAWHRNMNSLHKDQMNAKIEKDAETMTQMQLLQKKIQKTNMVKFFSILKDKNQSSVFLAWRSASKRLRSIRLASLKFNTTSKARRCLFAVNKWFDFLKVSQTRLSKSNKAINLYMQKLILRVFNSWKTLHEVGKYFAVVFGGVNKRYYRDCLFTGLAAIRTYAQEQNAHNSWRQRGQGSIINKVLFTKAKKVLRPRFDKWKAFVPFKLTASGKVRRSILRALSRKYRTAFDLWLECFKIKKTVESVNRGGTVAVENAFLRDRNEILEGLIRDEGIDPKYVERYINERENLKSALKRKGIERLRYKAGLVNPNDNSLLPRIFMTWKLWVVKRQRIMKYATRINAFRRKPDLMKAFSTWKKGFPLVVNAISKLPRQQLYGLVARMDRDIKTLEGRLENTNGDLVYMNAYTEVLHGHTKRGQNLALVLGKLNTQKTLYRVFTRWNVHTGLCKVHDLLAQLTAAEENLYITKTTLKALEEDNLTLVDENTELRQASLDGIAIAEAFETLSKEREKLSVDLAERTATIKRLLEHNNELALRLKQFSAEEFVTPEREMFRSQGKF
jgi:hypothetical protein